MIFVLCLIIFGVPISLLRFFMIRSLGAGQYPSKWAMLGRTIPILAIALFSIPILFTHKKWFTKSRAAT